MSSDFKAALSHTRYIDSRSVFIRDFASKHAGSGDDATRAINLYYAIRDHIPYNMAMFGLDHDLFVASHCLQSTSTFCVPKAIALAAAARAVEIPARVGFADVRNHLVPPRILKLMETDLFMWHAYTSLFLNGRWVKATPAFDLGLCTRYGVKPLEFDGMTDSIFHPFDASGREHMEYVTFHGEFDDLPYDRYADAMLTYYPRMLTALAADRAAKVAPSRN